MCRILGIVADEPAAFRFCLHDAPRSLAFLSHEHPDGWGVAVYGGGTGWVLGKEPLSAFNDPRFTEVAEASRGEVLVAHIRRRTVGPISTENTHPFRSGRWVFAHNGTINDIAHLRTAASPARLAEVKGSTDSELLFAYLLTHLDAAAPTAPGERPPASGPDVDAAITGAVVLLAARPDFGAFNFLLTDGETLYAFRLGRTLHVLERTEDGAPPGRAVGDVAPGDARARQPGQRRAVLVASEPITDEAWVTVEERVLLKVSRTPRPGVTVLATL